MKKFNLKVGGIKELLTKDQMKRITGGYTCAEQGVPCSFCQSNHYQPWDCFDEECGVVIICGPNDPPFGCWPSQTCSL